MKNHIISFLVCMILLNGLFAQSTNFPKGGYRTYEEFKKKQPSIPYNFKIEKRTKGDIKMNGGNDYRITSDSISKKIIKKDLYAISNGDTLFINCALQRSQWWYANVLTEGKYLAFLGGIGPVANNNSNAAAGVAFGAIGGAISGASAAMLRFLYVMDINDGQLKLLTRKYLEILLENYPDLKTQFQNEQNKDNEETLLVYLKRINAHQ